jgi:hypothetical protein
MISITDGDKPVSDALGQLAQLVEDRANPGRHGARTELPQVLDQLGVSGKGTEILVGHLAVVQEIDHARTGVGNPGRQSGIRRGDPRSLDDRHFQLQPGVFGRLTTERFFDDDRYLLRGLLRFRPNAGRRPSIVRPRHNDAAGSGQQPPIHQVLLQEVVRCHTLPRNSLVAGLGWWCCPHRAGSGGSWNGRTILDLVGNIVS